MQDSTSHDLRSHHVALRFQHLANVWAACLGFRVQGLEFRVEGLGFRVLGFGFLGTIIPHKQPKLEFIARVPSSVQV